MYNLKQLEELLKLEKWAPITDENFHLIDEQRRIGHMQFSQFKDDDSIIDVARLTQRGYKILKREYISVKGGFKKFFYNYFNAIDFYLSLGDRLFVGNPKR